MHALVRSLRTLELVQHIRIQQIHVQCCDCSLSLNFVFACALLLSVLFQGPADPASGLEGGSSHSKAAKRLLFIDTTDDDDDDDDDSDDDRRAGRQRQQAACGICFESFPADRLLFTKLPASAASSSTAAGCCSHKYCSGCLQQYVGHEMQVRPVAVHLA